MRLFHASIVGLLGLFMVVGMNANLTIGRTLRNILQNIRDEATDPVMAEAARHWERRVRAQMKRLQPRPRARRAAA